MHFQYAFQNKQDLIAISFDIAKAYDTTWRYHILKSMQELGLQGNILHYTKNFLSDRIFKVKSNGCLSEPKTQINGIPQGEIYSVTLFLIAFNKITNFIGKSVKISLYADDLVIYHRNKNLTYLKSVLQNTIKNPETWTRETGFQFSAQKTQAIHFSKKTNTSSKV